MKNFMQKFMDFVAEKVAPSLQKVAQNPYISGMQAAILKCVPMVFVSSLVTVYNQAAKHITLPSIAPISTYTFGLISIFYAYLVPYFILERKGNDKAKYVGGMTGLALFMMLVKPFVNEDGLYVYNFNNFGAGGLFVAIVAGIFTVIVFNLFSKVRIFKEDSAMPDFCKEWFDTMFPVAAVIIVGFILVFLLDFDLYTFISNLFMPIVNIANSYPGFILLYMIPTILYTMGISGWVFQPILNPVGVTALAANEAAHLAGTALPYVYAGGVATAYLSLGGRGVTFMLVIFCMLSKAKGLKALGNACLVPNILNINEPIIFGAIAWNPVLMIPTWIASFVVCTITYIVLRAGLVPIPYENFSLWYFPILLTGYLVSGNLSGVILAAVNLAVSAVIFYPFFKIYERQMLEEEALEVEDLTATEA